MQRNKRRCLIFRVARATCPSRWATSPAEWEGVAALPVNARLPNVRPTRSGRLVANRHRLVACATHFKFGCNETNK